MITLVVTTDNLLITIVLHINDPKIYIYYSLFCYSEWHIEDCGQEKKYIQIVSSKLSTQFSSV